MTQPTPGPACDVLVPTLDRAGALAVTLAGLAGQPPAALARVVIADQSGQPVAEHPLVAAMLRTLAGHGVPVEVHRRDVRRGVAEQRAFLLGRATAETVLMLDDDVWLEPWAVPLMAGQLAQHGCGFVGMAVTGLSHAGDHRPHQQAPFEAWAGPVQPEDVRPGTPAWQRHQLHNAANPTHLAARVGATPQRPVAYRVAWVGGCVLYRRAALEAVGGFGFWERLPPRHAGEDVLAQLRVMRRFGGAGVLPSGAVHLELPTTIPERLVDAWAIEDQLGKPVGAGRA
ncbi:MAG: glycosyltransferase [Candidatus Nanopelagicales bacterium]|nr:glycosyltransferase [Candidatus Nanopelagicales bacterium]